MDRSAAREAIFIDDRATEPTMPFLRLNFATLWVRDQERSRRFFVDQLGFQAIVDVEAPDHGRWIVVAPCTPHWLPGTAGGGLPGIAIIVPPKDSDDSNRIGRNTGLSFLTEDVHAVFEKWSERGVRFTLPPTEPDWGSGQARYALFEDVDGNSFSLIEFDEATRTVEAERRAQAARVEAERRSAQELAIAKQVQARLFPQCQPTVPALDYTGLCLQARTVGGDYYDFLDLGSERLALVVGDIAGKGIAASLLMANLQANLRSQSAIAADQPQQFLSAVNRLLHQNTEEHAYATLFFSDFDHHSGRLLYANCGHLPGLILRANGDLDRLEATCTVLGLFPDLPCALAETRLAPGDLLALFTDGLTESFNQAEEEFGEERLIEALRRNAAMPARGHAQAIVEEVLAFSGREQFDDITLILAKRSGESSSTFSKCS